MPETVYYFVDAVEANKPLFQNFEFWTTLGALTGSFAAAFAAFFAWRSTAVLAKQAKIYDRPYLCFGSNIIMEFYVGKTPAQFLARIPVQNTGKVPLYYHVTNVVVDGTPVAPAIFDQKIAIFQESTSHISLPMLPLNLGMSPANFHITIDTEITYSDAEDKPHILRRTFDIANHLGKPGATWTNYRNDFFN